MSVSRAPLILALVALLFLGSLPISFPVAGQAQQFCPTGDGGTGPPPNTPPQAIKPVTNLAVGDVTLSLAPAGAAAQNGTVKGVYTVFNETGQLNVTAQVRKVGTLGSGNVDVKVVVGKPDGSTLTQTAPVAVPAAVNSPTEGYFHFSVGPGRHTIFVHVNPSGSPAETCTDSAPNPNCPDSSGFPQPCSQTYYLNNRKTVGSLVDSQPDLKVRSITVQGPTRAMAAAHDDSKATVRVTVANEGNAPAFNLSQLNPGAAKFQVLVSVDACDCADQKLDIAQLAVGQETTVSATFAVHGLRDLLHVGASADPLDWVVESNETNGVTNLTFPLPTPDLVATGIADLPREGNAYVIPKGRDLHFEATVSNTGTARAEGAAGEAFRVTVHQDDKVDTDLLLDNTLRLPGLGSSAYAVTVPAARLTGTHTFTIHADRGETVYESSDSNNKGTLSVVVAIYKATMTVEAADRTTTVPPGITGHIPFTLKNTGTVSDTYDFVVPDGLAARQRYTNADGDPVTEITLAAGASFKGEVEFDINSTDPKDKRFTTQAWADSRTIGEGFSQQVEYVVGEDNVAPTITLEEPASGFLSGNSVIVKIRDNVAVDGAETDLSGSFETMEPTPAGGTLYTLDVLGRPNRFSFTVRASDPNGNSASQTFTITRDTTAPRISKVTFTPDKGLAPGMTTTLLVEADDENMDRVEVQVTQKRPGGLLFQQDWTLRFNAGRFRLDDWVVPDRPGYYRFNITAYDKAGNVANKPDERLTINGLDIRFVGGRPQVSTAAPVEGQRVTLRYVIENTCACETGDFLVAFVIDRDRTVGVESLNMGPGSREVVDFVWFVQPGTHEFSVILDQALEVNEDDEGAEGHNVLTLTTQQLWPDNPLFEGDEPKEIGTLSFVERIQRFWYMPALLVAIVVLFVIATVLQRRPRV